MKYLDFENYIRNEKSFQQLIYGSIMDLKKRNIVPWININKLWYAHINNKRNFADALLVLASLEIHLKAGKKTN